MYNVQARLAPLQKQVVRMAYGKANFTHILATYAVLVVTAPFNRKTALTAGPVVPGSKSNTSVGEYQTNGGIAACSVSVEDGTVILLQSSWKRGASSMRDGAIFLRTRSTARALEVHANVPTHPENTIGPSFVTFAGRADILDLQGLYDLGIDPSSYYLSRFQDSADEVAECFSLYETSPEIASKPKVEAIATPTGVIQAEVRLPPQRRMRSRRPT